MRHDDASGTWRWGDVFEVDLADGLLIKDLDDAVELALAGPDGAAAGDARIHLAVLSPLPTEPAASVRDAITRFAGSHGLGALPSSHLEVRTLGPGVATGRLAFVVADTAWLVLALAWGRHLVLAFATASSPEDPIFDAAESLLADLRPLEVVAPRALPPEPPGDF